MDDDELVLQGVGRDAENERTLCLYFNRRLTDREIFFIHGLVREWVPGVYPDAIKN